MRLWRSNAALPSLFRVSAYILLFLVCSVVVFDHQRTVFSDVSSCFAPPLQECGACLRQHGCDWCSWQPKDSRAGRCLPHNATAMQRCDTWQPRRLFQMDYEHTMGSGQHESQSKRKQIDILCAVDWEQPKKPATWLHWLTEPLTSRNGSSAQGLIPVVPDTFFDTLSRAISLYTMVAASYLLVVMCTKTLWMCACCVVLFVPWEAGLGAHLLVLLYSRLIATMTAVAGHCTSAALYLWMAFLSPYGWHLLSAGVCVLLSVLLLRWQRARVHAALIESARRTKLERLLEDARLQAVERELAAARLEQDYRGALVVQQVLRDRAESAGNAQAALQQLEARHRELQATHAQLERAAQQRAVCCVCNEEPPIMLLRPCHHVPFCQACAQQWSLQPTLSRRCPNCRGSVQAVQRIYL